MSIVHYPHPALRHRSKPLRRVDLRLKKLVGQMFELMYEANGVGLAANQVDLPFQLFVVNATGDRNQANELVFVNAVLSNPRGHSTAEEGCLSMPGVFGNVTRAERIHVAAYDLQGNAVSRTFDGALARVIQHEYDHTQGVMFIDRMNPLDVKAIAADIERFERTFSARLLNGEQPTEQQWMETWTRWSTEYCVT